MTAVPTHRDLAYAELSTAQRLDLYLPTVGSGRPSLIVNIHGGAFKLGDKAMEADNIAHQLDAGYAAASLNYRLSGEAFFPAAVEDVKAAVRWLRAHADTYGYDPDRFVVWGESAGGYLAQMVAITGGQPSSFDAPHLGHAEVSSAVRAAVTFYGPNDFGAMDPQFAASSPAACGGSPQAHDPADSPESLFLGAALPEIPELVRQANPLTYLATTTELPPFYVAAGDQDCLVPHQQSIELARAVEAAGGHAELTIVPGVGHGSAVDAVQVGPALDFLARVLSSAAS
ncbi:MAG: alpha/beta hydrolase [Propionibacteriaceae bacterium]